MLLATAILVAVVWAFSKWYFGFNDYISAFTGIAAGILLSFISVEVLADLSMEPIKTVRQAVLHIDPTRHTSAAPNLDKVRFGRELVNQLILRIYQYASHQDSSEQIRHRTEISQAANIVRHLPLPLFVFNKELQVTNASDTAISYCATESAQLFGRPVFATLDLEFQNTNTLEKWILDCRDSKVTDTNYWEHVRVVTTDGQYRHCDLAATYNRDNSGGAEFIVTLFDRTTQYGHDDDAMSFISLAVHELRTPLTMLRGYIEVFEEEVGPSLEPELHDFMRKMKASADLLGGFVHNILNVAKVENNQLSLHLLESDWPSIILKSAETMELRAQVHGITLEYAIAPDIPPAAVDPITIQEVLNNLIDNSIKYSVGSKSKKIIISCQVNREGLIETTVQDFGLGIPDNVMPHMFEKFYRNHRTRASVGGTGLGLFLSKAIVDAHGGNIWAKSKVDEGSIFGFTLVPYSALPGERKQKDPEVIRQANGWIKNHSFYRS